MTTRKPAAGPGFRTASDLLKEDTGKSENRRRLDNWADALVRDKKLSPSWKEDDELAAVVKSIADPTKGVAVADGAKKPGRLRK